MALNEHRPDVEQVDRIVNVHLVVDVDVPADATSEEWEELWVKVRALQRRGGPGFVTM